MKYVIHVVYSLIYLQYTGASRDVYTRGREVLSGESLSYSTSANQWSTSHTKVGATSQRQVRILRHTSPGIRQLGVINHLSNIARRACVMRHMPINGVGKIYHRMTPGFILTLINYNYE